MEADSPYRELTEQLTCSHEEPYHSSLVTAACAEEVAITVSTRSSAGER